MGIILKCGGKSSSPATIMIYYSYNTWFSLIVELATACMLFILASHKLDVNDIELRIADYKLTDYYNFFKDHKLILTNMKVTGIIDLLDHLNNKGCLIYSKSDTIMQTIDIITPTQLYYIYQTPINNLRSTLEHSVQTKQNVYIL
jgi:hypothetical protein